MSFRCLLKHNKPQQQAKTVNFVGGSKNPGKPYENLMFEHKDQNIFVAKKQVALPGGNHPLADFKKFFSFCI